MCFIRYIVKRVGYKFGYICEKFFQNIIIFFYYNAAFLSILIDYKIKIYYLLNHVVFTSSLQLLSFNLSLVTKEYS